MKNVKMRLASSLLALAMLTPSSLTAFAGGENTPVSKSPLAKVDDKGTTYLDVNTDSSYYKYPNWDEESVSNKGAERWELGEDQKLTAVSIPSEAYQTVQLNYDGYHEDGNGNLILDLKFSWATRADSVVWKKMDLFISKDLEKRIDWTRSYYYNGLRKYKVNFESGSTKQDKIMKFSEMVQGVLAGSVHHTPIKLFLKNTKRADLDKIDTTIQSRTINDAGTQVYTKYLGAYPNSNLILEGYNSYTSVTSVPKVNATNFRKDLLPSLRNFGGLLGGREDTPDVLASQTSVSYHPDTNQLYVASQWRKGSTGATGNVDYAIDDDLMAYRLAFNKELLDSLKEDENGYIGYIEPSTTSGYAAINMMKNVTGFRKDDVNIDGDMAFVLFAPDGYKAKDGKKFVKTNGGTNGFVNNQSTLLTVSQYTVTRLNVYTDKLKKLYPTIQDNSGNQFKPELLPLDFHSCMVLDNSLGMDTVSVNTTKEIVAKKDSTVKIVFDKAPSAGAATKQQNEAKTLAMKLANLPLAGDLAVYSQGDAGTRYADTSFTLSNGDKTYTSKLLSGVKIPEGSQITLYAGYGGKLVGNSGKIYIDDQEVASFGQSDAKKSFSPRALVGTESMASTLLDRTQYMPSLDDVFDIDGKIEGYTYLDNQMVDISYFDKSSDKFKFMEAPTLRTGANGAKYVVNNKTYPEAGKHLYRYSEDIEKGDKLVKDSPVIARAFRYDMADQVRSIIKNRDNEINLKSAVASDPVIGKVQSVVTFDLDGGKLEETAEKPIKSFEGYKDDVNKQDNYKVKRTNDTDPIKRILPLNKKFSTETDYKANGFNDENAVLKDNMGNELKGDALDLRKFPTANPNDPTPSKEGLSFLGWTTKKVDGSAQYITEEFAKLEEAKTLEDLKSDKPHIFTDKTPVDKSITVYAVYGSPAIRIHSNFDTDANKEGMQETVDKQFLSDEVVKKLASESDLSKVSAKLEHVNNKKGFERAGYCLVGFSRNKDADEPDINITGDGLTQDLYLRDGDSFKLADKGKTKTKSGEEEYSYSFDRQKGLDLYAVWKKNFTVKASKTWADKAGKQIEEDSDHTKNLKFALIGRPAVGTFGYEVVARGATYYPIKGTIKDYNPKGMVWENMKGYDEQGRRMSYIIVELRTKEQIDAFNAGSTKWEDYGIKIEEKVDNPDGTVKHYGRKTQWIELGTHPDAFSSATVRKHTSKDHPEGVIPHAKGVNLGYFDSTGYVIDVKNTVFDVLPPRILQAYVADSEDKRDEDNKVFVKPPQRQLDKLIIETPDNEKLVLIQPPRLDPSKTYPQYVKDNEESTSDVEFEQKEDGTIVLSPKSPLKKDDKYVATSVIVAGSNDTQAKAEMTVLDRPLSNKVMEIKQGKLEKDSDSKDLVPITFKVPQPGVLNKVSAGTIYTILIKDKTGNVSETTYTYTIPVEGAETAPGTYQTIKVPKADLVGDKTIIIKAKEPNKKSVNSDEFKPDLTGPKAKENQANAMTERWRRWADLDVVFDETPVGDITISYEKGASSYEVTAESKDLAEITVQELAFDKTVSNIKVKATDEFGNEEESDVNFIYIDQTEIMIRPIKKGKNFVIVSPTEENTKITINVFDKGTDLNTYPRDKYFQITGENPPTPKASAVIDKAQLKNYKLKLHSTVDGSVYKLQAGDVVDIVGTINNPGDEGYKITNPYTEIVK
jgi:hypothetical protein